MAEPKPMEIGRYTVLSTLGRGAASTIQKVRREADGLVYVLKEVTVRSSDDWKYVDQCEHEFEVGSKFDHPHLIKVYAFEKVKRFFRTVGARVLIEYLDGISLGACKITSPLRLVSVFFRAADGLAYMHSKGYFHADIKPDNILLGRNGEVKIIDFGLAWEVNEKKDRVQGTEEFLAPEQARKKRVNHKTDIFNFGATMYRVLTGKPVPAQLRAAGVKRLGGMDKIVQPVTVYNPDVPEELDEFVRQCIRPKATERPHSMVEVRDRLREIGKRMKHQSNLDEAAN